MTKRDSATKQRGGPIGTRAESGGQRSNGFARGESELAAVNGIEAGCRIGDIGIACGFCMFGVRRGRASSRNDTLSAGGRAVSKPASRNARRASQADLEDTMQMHYIPGVP